MYEIEEVKLNHIIAKNRILVYEAKKVKSNLVLNYYLTRVFHPNHLYRIFLKILYNYILIKMYEIEEVKLN